ncbi:hypothetical protein COU13_01255 [Candidatus Kaiserbacteria bacterium CG10_big_fil_rev_8_21_14_0_10_43_70]|uniref:Uncharacterized protein n=1 Tax=Candidatus Kaiserbacteria bacterium CG10_big_fil_rev_8_21_14_0_10_43_70 TaxID=1974605 RepID=A0A2H0UL40_9BACT|nr:MAG: hypothetical protein COU13_01255 [Candidatus Kaiserbacteria bacterium CG10_big_fil_rev_8_21_14_0_10_43_70]
MSFGVLFNYAEIPYLEVVRKGLKVMAEKKPKPLPRDTSRFRNFAPDGGQPSIQANPDKTLGYISTLELIYESK